MFTVHPDGSITCDTAEEALRLQQMILAKKPRNEIQRAVDGYLTGVASIGTFSAAGTVSDATARQFLEKLKPHDGQELDSTKLAEILGSETTNGVGPKLRFLRAALEREGISLDDYLVARFNGDGTKAWRVALPQGVLPFAEKAKG